MIKAGKGEILSVKSNNMYIKHVQTEKTDWGAGRAGLDS